MTTTSQHHRLIAGAPNQVVATDDDFVGAARPSAVAVARPTLGRQMPGPSVEETR